MNQGSTAALFRNIDWQFLFVRTLNLLNYCWNVFKKQSVKSSRFLVDSFSPNVYIFFEGSSIPVAARDYKQTAAGTPAIAAYYDRDTQAIHTDLTPTNPHTILFDSVNIYHRDINLYDLTDFFNDTKFYGTPASLDTWVAAWCLETSIYLDRKKSFTLRCKQFLEDDVKTFSLWSTDDEEKQEWTRICRPPGTFHHQNIRRVDISGNTVCMPTNTGVTQEETIPSNATEESLTQEIPESSTTEEESSKVE
jgi:hypothetical protein